MGAWGAGLFDNDDVMDWLADLEEAKDWSLVEIAFAAVIADDVEYREAPECSVALGAAALVAAKVRAAPIELPKAAQEWVQRVPMPHPGLPAVAVECIDAVLQDSELKDLWEESDSFKAWKAALRSLRKSLVGSSG
jgi:hypothetical protein